MMTGISNDKQSLCMYICIYREPLIWYCAFTSQRGRNMFDSAIALIPHLTGSVGYFRVEEQHAHVLSGV
jgi:hypothetical protein